MDQETKSRIRVCISGPALTWRKHGLDCRHIRDILRTHFKRDIVGINVARCCRAELVALLRKLQPASRFKIIGRDTCPKCREARTLLHIDQYTHDEPALNTPSEYTTVPQIFQDGVFIGGLDELKVFLDGTDDPEAHLCLPYTDPRVATWKKLTFALWNVQQIMQDISKAHLHTLYSAVLNLEERMDALHFGDNTHYRHQRKRHIQLLGTFQDTLVSRITALSQNTPQRLPHAPQSPADAV